MKDLVSVEILERGENTTVSHWVSNVDGRKIVWTEKDTFYPEELKITYAQTEGDLKRMEGQWLIEQQGDACEVTLAVDFEFGIPMIAGLLNPILKKKVREEKMKREVIDVTLPGKTHEKGHRHPNQIALEDLERVFIGMGYEVVEGPEVEYDYYNFEALNIPANHPAKDEQDTFYINKDIVLRTQTSPVQARIMEQGKLPIRMIAPGRVFRSDEVDATHSPSFHQIEGLVIDKNITFADLKGTLQEFAQELFGPETKTKFRPHHFPFTEPSAEVDVSCFKCGGKGCRFCKGSGWIEILGCGMVHPNVLSMCGIDPEEYTGFAFGVGLERIALLKYEIDDMRLLYENDIRFLKQF